MKPDGPESHNTNSAGRESPATAHETGMPADHLAYLSDPGRSLRDPIRARVIESHQWLVLRIAHGIRKRLPSSVDGDDVVGDGMVGLIDAVDKYDPAKNDSFVGYARIRIQGAILDGLRSLDWVPRSVRQDESRIQRARSDLLSRLQRKPTAGELAAELGYSPDELAAIQARLLPQVLVSFEALAGDGGAQDVQPQLHDDKAPNPLKETARQQVAEMLWECIAELREREQVVVWSYYFEERTFRDIGEELSVTESRVSQIHRDALLRLAKKIKNRTRDPG